MSCWASYTTVHLRSFVNCRPLHGSVRTLSKPLTCTYASVSKQCIWYWQKSGDNFSEARTSDWSCLCFGAYSKVWDCRLFFSNEKICRQTNSRTRQLAVWMICRWGNLWTAEFWKITFEWLTNPNFPSIISANWPIHKSSSQQLSGPRVRELTDCKLVCRGIILGLIFSGWFTFCHFLFAGHFRF